MAGTEAVVGEAPVNEGHICNTCQARFSTIERVKEHYRGDWHIFNSKRRAGGLVPLTKDDFRAVGHKIVKKNAPPAAAPTAVAAQVRAKAKAMDKVAAGGPEAAAALAFLKGGAPTSPSASAGVSSGGGGGGASATKAKAPPLSWGGITANTADELRQLAKDMGVGEDRMDNIIELALQRRAQEMVDMEGAFFEEDEEEEGAGAAAASSSGGGGVKKSKKRAAKATSEGGGKGGEGEAADEEEGDEEEEEEEEEEEPDISPNVSIFDNKRFETTDECVQYMADTFGFFIPDLEYLSDKDGLIEYLNGKVKLGGLCLYCQKQLQPGWPCQNHMMNKSHCKIAYKEGVDLDEYEDFYDFEAQYEGLPLDEDGEPIQPVSHISELGELVLPDGKRAGHRDLRVYYKQYYRPAEDRPSVLAVQREELIRVGAQLGGSYRYQEQDLVAMPDVQVCVRIC